MFNLNRTYIILCIVFIGISSSVFAVDFSEAFTQANQQSNSIDSLFKWKSTVSNLYSKALKIVKDKEIVSTNVAFDKLKTYFGVCTTLQNKDFIHILYNANYSFRNTFALILPSSTKIPLQSDITKSYQKFFTCKNIQNPTNTDVSNLNAEVNRVYYNIYTNAHTISTLNNSNFWSDLFWNGTLDDSDFDLLYDINQVGKILFESFKDSPQLLFYRLPTLQQASSQNGDNWASLFQQGSYQLGGGGSSSIGTNWLVGWTSPLIPPGWWSSTTITTTTTTTTTTSTKTKIIPSAGNSSVFGDKEVQNFISKNNPSASSSVPIAGLLFWNQCLVDDTPGPVVEEEIDPLMTPEAYMSGINNFIADANIEDVVNTTLLHEFYVNNPLPSWWTTSTSWYGESIANAYAEQAFGEPALGTCEYGCKDLPLDKQAECQFSCAKACIQTCTDTHTTDKNSCSSAYNSAVTACDTLSFVKKPACFVAAVAQRAACASQATTDNLLCVSDCTCFLIAWPNGVGWQKMEDMFRIKFCKVPVQSKSVSPGKTVYSIQGIFQEIADVLAWLKDSGEMVKYSKTKEFLDGNIKITFADNFAFKIIIWFKPVFPKVSTTTKIQQQTQANIDLSLAVLDMNVSAPLADDYNKYIVVASPILTQAGKEPIITFADLNTSIAKLQAASEKAKEAKISTESIDGAITNYAQNNKILFVQNVLEFLKDNQYFLNNLSDALIDMRKMSLELKTRIENSK